MEQALPMIQFFLILYLLMLVGIGYVASKRMKGLEDYVLAGRGIGSYVMAFTFSATGMSGWLGLGLAGYVYRSGFEGVWTMVPSATVGIFLSFALVSKMVRKYSENVGAITIPDVLEARYYDKSRILRIISALIILAAAIAYVNGQLVAFGVTFEAVLGWNYSTTIVLAAIMFVAWTMLGGLLAICWTDFIQGILMVLGTAMAGAFAIALSGGIGELSMGAAEIAKTDPDFIISPFATMPAIIYGISLFMGDGIFSWIGQPTLMVRYMAAKDAKTLNLSGLMAVFIQSILFGGTFLAALYMRTQFPEASGLPMAGNTETVLIQFFTTMTHPIFAGIFIGSILAAIMSTADSMLIMGSSTLVNDFYIKIFKPDLDKRKALYYGRVATLVLGVLGVLLSLRGGSVLIISWFGWNTLGLFGGPVLLGLYWPRATREGAIAGLSTGFILLVLWSFLGLEGTTNIFQAFPAALATYVVTYIVSLMTPAPPEEIQEGVRALRRKKAS
ncbi:sodium/proline symporter [Tindallia californiensis]|uniref:Sodium/proline symporter n=1 Tax=Tindallia californiensis TaxID=159292 RepID=A0A1H3PH97_9FIRM|nr:sodium/proline symporter [Tindallia californiensis]SDZ00522.1 solute:Na+ symporter, SSS family/sodium/proline symporter [Tindallia californiensis]